MRAQIGLEFGTLKGLIKANLSTKFGRNPINVNGGDYSTEWNGTERNDGLNHGTERFLKLKLATYHC